MTHVNYPSETPNVGVAGLSDPRVRFWTGLILYSLAILVQLFSIFVADTVIDAASAPWVEKVSDAISLLAAVFGVAVSTPNVPRSIK